MNFKNYTNDQLIQFIMQMVYYDEIPYAFDELAERSPQKAFDLGIDILINDKGDHFLQACIWSSCSDINENRTINLMCQRKKLMEWSLVESILLHLYNFEMNEFPFEFKRLIVDSYNNISEEKKNQYSELFDHFLKKSQKSQ